MEPTISVASPPPDSPEPPNRNRKKVSAGGVHRDAAGRLLLVKPTYKAGWDLPGGILEAGESPVDGLVREVREELGARATVGRLLAVDYGAADWEGAEIIMLTLAVELDPADPDGFRLQPDEIEQAAFFDVDDALDLVTPRMRDRLRVALELGPAGPHGILVSREG